MLLYLIPFAIILAADQITKFLVAKNMAVGESFTLIPKFMDITYVQNQGAAFGIFQGRKALLIVVSLLIFAAVIWYIVHYKPKSRWIMWSLTMIIAGGLGNLIDRVALSYVRDFLDETFTKYNFPVFNIADCAITIGAIMLALHVLIGGIRDEANVSFDSDTDCPQ